MNGDDPTPTRFYFSRWNIGRSQTRRHTRRLQLEWRCMANLREHGDMKTICMANEGAGKLERTARLAVYRVASWRPSACLSCCRRRSHRLMEWSSDGQISDGWSGFDCTLPTAAVYCLSCAARRTTNGEIGQHFGKRARRPEPCTGTTSTALYLPAAGRGKRKRPSPRQ